MTNTLEFIQSCSWNKWLLKLLIWMGWFAGYCFPIWLLDINSDLWHFWKNGWFLNWSRTFFGLFWVLLLHNLLIFTTYCPESGYFLLLRLRFVMFRPSLLFLNCLKAYSFILLLMGYVVFRHFIFSLNL